MVSSENQATYDNQHTRLIARWSSATVNPIQSDVNALIFLSHLQHIYHFGDRVVYVHNLMCIVASYHWRFTQHSQWLSSERPMVHYTTDTSIWFLYDLWVVNMVDCSRWGPWSGNHVDNAMSERSPQEHASALSQQRPVNWYSCSYCTGIKKAMLLFLCKTSKVQNKNKAAAGEMVPL